MKANVKSIEQKDAIVHDIQSAKRICQNQNQFLAIPIYFEVSCKFLFWLKVFFSLSLKYNGGSFIRLIDNEQ